MVKYKTKEHTFNGVKYVFVTRGKSAQFSDEEIDSFISGIKTEEPLAPTQAEEEIVQSGAREIAEGLARQFLANGQFAVSPPQKEFVVPVERTNLFLSDLKRGIEFCTKKYGVRASYIISEARRVFPSLNLNKLWEKKESQDVRDTGQVKRP